jgi:hypothetical protein
MYFVPCPGHVKNEIVYMLLPLIHKCSPIMFFRRGGVVAAHNQFLVLVYHLIF